MKFVVSFLMLILAVFAQGQIDPTWKEKCGCCWPAPESCCGGTPDTTTKLATTTPFPCPDDPLVWMCSLPEELQTVSFSKLAIPGAHDAFSAYLVTDPLPSITCAPLFYQNLEVYRQSAYYPVYGDAGYLQSTYGWARTQTLSVTQQLQLGIRYLDLRVCGAEDYLPLIHTLYSHPVVDVLQEVDAFLDQDGYQREIVFIHFEHLFAFDATIFQEFYDVVIAALGSRLCVPTEEADCIHEFTLQMAWEQNCQVVVMLDDAYAETAPEFWSNKDIVNYWPDKTTADDVIEFLTNSYDSRNTSSSRFLAEYKPNITPDQQLVLVEKPLSSLQQHVLVDEALNTRARAWVEDKTDINVVQFDFVETPADYILAIINLNYQ